MSFDINRAAVVFLDCEEGVASGVFAQGGGDADRAQFVSSAAKLLVTVTDQNLPALRVDVEFREGHPEVSPRNAYFSAAKDNGRLVAGTDATKPMADLPGLETLPRVVKKRIGGFAGSDLPHLLAGLDCDGVILAGLITRGAVLSTACEAADRDYRVAVLTDCSYDFDPEVHKVLTTSVLPLRAAMLTLDDLVPAKVGS
ncbi:isochorismatase family protein [Mycolicibacterium farcinogenes]|uniref:cysteine hydrolase family protein n=1 Tax=Mycolicibacterium farcinogenes TaxID=1802 RepID=UPI001C8ED354|nr:isochorismatase family protein [Mycolicibacterium farcinogenes]QZH60902.1 isochorismatase family protein [Mycolicibacterium farcinogenes]